MSRLRATRVLVLFVLVTLPLMPVQAVLLAAGSPAARRLPHWYHRLVCRILGVRVHLQGSVPPDSAVLLVANHISWLDIPVISSVAPLSFVAKREVAGWPFIGWLAKLQRTVFIDRERRSSASEQADDIARRLAAGEHILLFAEGTSGDGNQVLPFKSSLFAAAAARETQPQAALIQTLTIAYTHIHGLPLNRQQRPAIAWYGDMDMATHAWDVLKRGPIDVAIRLSEPHALTDAGDRKRLATWSEQRVKADFAALITGRG